MCCCKAHPQATLGSETAKRHDVIGSLGTRPKSTRILDSDNQNHDYGFIATEVVTFEHSVESG